jgi:hypothetical protein
MSNKKYNYLICWNAKPFTITVEKVSDVRYFNTSLKEYSYHIESGFEIFKNKSNNLLSVRTITFDNGTWYSVIKDKKFFIDDEEGIAESGIDRMYIDLVNRYIVSLEL